VCEQSSGSLSEHSYEGIVTGEELLYLAYLPPCYSSTKAYPILTLLHGYPFDENHWLNLDLIPIYEEGFNDKGWPGVIFILPRVPDTLFIHSDGGVGSYEQELIEGLIPEVARAFPVSTDAKSQLLGGVSRGGVWALEIGLRNIDQFDTILALSPALVYNQPRPRYDPFEIVREDLAFPSTIFISAAENESPFLEEIERFIELLVVEDINHDFMLHPGNHNDQTWKAVMEDILNQILPRLGSIEGME
jgi:enterochelin esterase-like enzyme